MNPIFKYASLGDTQYEDREWRLRDYNGDGVMDYRDYERYAGHYQHMTMFWNQLKKLNDATDTRPDYQPIDLDGDE